MLSFTDDFVAGAHIWVELKAAKFKELTDKVLAEMGVMGEMGLNVDKEDSIFVQSPPSMSSMIGLPEVSVTLGVTSEELVVSAGKSAPNAVKNLGTDSIASKMDSSLSQRLRILLWCSCY